MESIYNGLPVVYAPHVLFPGCVLDKLNKFTDKRGDLVPVYECVEPKPLNVYYMFTREGQFRGKDEWHVHQEHTDRFICVYGLAMIAVSDGETTKRAILSSVIPSLLTIPNIVLCWSKGFASVQHFGCPL